MKYERLTERTKHGIAVLDSGERFVLSCGGYATTKALKHLAELEDKIEQGTLIELPCKVGTIVYYVASLHITKFFNRTIIYDIVESPFTLEMLDAYGNNWFLTREEAEARLKELKELKE